MTGQTTFPRARCKGCLQLTIYKLDNGYCPACIKEMDSDWWAAEQRQDAIGQNGNDGLHYPTGPTAPSILLKAREHLKDRAATYDTPAGERSMAAAVGAFNALTEHTLSPSDGWLLLAVLKIVRNRAASPHKDSLEDLVAYSALYAEEEMRHGKNSPKI